MIQLIELPIKNTSYTDDQVATFVAKHLQKDTTSARAIIATRDSLNAGHFTSHKVIIARYEDQIVSVKLAGDRDHANNARTEILEKWVFRLGKVVAITIPDPPSRKALKSKVEPNELYLEITEKLRQTPQD